MADTQAQAATVPDPVPANTFDDEDLIDYDDDDEPEPKKEVVSGKAVGLGTPPNDTAKVDATALDQTPNTTAHSGNKAATTKIQEQIAVNDPKFEQDEIDYDDDEEEVLNGGSASLRQPAEPKEAEKVDQQVGHDQEDEEIDFGITEDTLEIPDDIAAMPVPDGRSPFVDDTTVEHDENTATQEGRGTKGDELVTGVDEGYAQVTAELSDPVPVSTDPAQSNQQYGRNETSQANLAEKDEITWEDAEDENETALEVSRHASQSTSGKVGAEEAPVTQAEPAQEYVTGDQVEAGDHTHEEAGNVDEEEYPAITVQYKGEEFPLFSITSEGFFTSTSILHDNIGSLLAGFRAELAMEIASEDELVFQIDELGLEYAESHSQDTLGQATLNQILEIHDLLVKNQDPDSDRALYTYLLTRPSTTKRFESLIESAAAGTGLDEVIFHFDSPVPDGTNREGDHLMAEFDNLDQYQSPADTNPKSEGQDGHGDEDYEYIEGLDDNTDVIANTSENSQVGQSGATENQEPHTTYETQPEQIAEGEIATATEVNTEGDVAGNGKHTQFFYCQPFDSFQSSTTPNLTPVHRYTRKGYDPSTISDFDMTFSQTDADETSPAFADTDFEMAMEAGDYGNVATGDFNVDGDLADEYQDGRLDITNAESSASNTIANEDAETGMTAEEAAEALDQYTEDKAPEHIEDEIDWRSEPGDDDTSTLSAGAIKRSHDTAGPNEDDGPDPKRQRS